MGFNLGFTYKHAKLAVDNYNLILSQQLSQFYLFSNFKEQKYINGHFS